MFRRNSLRSFPRAQGARETSKPSLEALESRLAPHGQKVAILVNGLGGLDIPHDVENYLLNNAGFKSDQVIVSNWNSFDRSVDPGGTGFTLAGEHAIPGTGKSIYTEGDITIDIGPKGANTDAGFVQGAIKYLSDNNFDSTDEIVLIGHSLGGSAVLDLARALNHQGWSGNPADAPLKVALLATLDPVGFIPNNDIRVQTLETAGNLGVDVASIAVAELTFGLFHLKLNFPNGDTNADGKTPGWRQTVDLAGLPAALPSVPSNVGLLFNRWQNNGFFPWDFALPGYLRVDSSATTQDQAPQETAGAPYGFGVAPNGLPQATNIDWGISLALGELDLNPFTTRKVNINITGIGPPVYVPVPTTNDDFGQSDAQQHLSLPDNPAVETALEHDLSLVVPTSITGTGGNDQFVIKASPAPGSVDVILNNTDLGPKPLVNGQVEINAQGDGNVTLTVDFSAGNLPDNTDIIFDGSNSTDTIVLEGGSFATEKITSTNQYNGSVTVGTTTVEFSNVNSLSSLSNVAGVEYDFFTVSHLINVVDGTASGVTATEINDSGFNDNGTNEFVTADIANATNIFINGTRGDVVTLNNPTPEDQLRLLGVDTGAGGATVNVWQTAAAVVTSITNSIANDDIINVGTDGSAQGILGVLNVENPAGFNTVLLDDSKDAAARTVTLSTLAAQPDSDTDQDGDSYGNIHGLAPADINYEYLDTTSVTIAGGAGDTFDVEANGDPSQGSAVTVNIVGSGRTTINVGNHGNSQGIVGTLNLENPSGLNTISVDDSADITGRTVTLSTLAAQPSSDTDQDGAPYGNLLGLTPADINYEYADTASIAIFGGASASGDTFNVQSTGCTTSIHADGTGNTLGGPNQNATWNIAANNAGDITGVVASFTDIQNLVGGDHDDTFVFGSGGSITGTLDGGLGNDTLDGPNQNATWNVTANNAGSISNVVPSFTNIQNLIGGSKDDTFVFGSSGSIAGYLSGGLGNNTLDETAVANSVVSIKAKGTDVGVMGTATGIGDTFDDITKLVGFTTLGAPDAPNIWDITGLNAGTLTTFGVTVSFQVPNLLGGSMTDTFNFHSGGSEASVDGVGGSNTIVGPPENNSWQVKGDDSGNIAAVVKSFKNIQNLTGGGAKDTFQFGPSGKIEGTIDGTAAGAANAAIVGPDASESWSVTGANAGGSTFANAFVNVANLTGGSGADTFTFGVGGSLAGLLDGGNGNNSVIGPNLTEKWTITGLNKGTLTDFAPIKLRSTFIEIQNLTGGKGQDVFTFQVGGNLTGKIDGGAGSDWLVYSALPTSINVNLSTGAASKVAGGVKNVENVIGSAKGGDTIWGNASGGVLEGHNGGNTIAGGGGLTIIIGGFGKSLLFAGGSEALIIAGSTSFDANITALSAILAEWQSGNGYATRVSHLRYGSGLNGSSRLVLGATVFTPPVPPGPRFGYGGGERQSTIVGNSAQDWFFTMYASIIDQRRPDEAVN